MNRRSAGGRVGGIIVTTLVVLWAALSALPVVIAVFSSLKSQTDIITSPLTPPIPPNFQGYVTAITGTLGGQSIAVYLRNSAISTAVGELLAITAAVLAGYYLARRSKGPSRIAASYFLVLLTLPPVVTLIPLFSLAGQLGIRDSPWGLGLVLAASQIPLAVILLRSFFMSFPKELIEAANLDGASEVRIFRSLVIPLTRGPIGTVALLMGIGMWNELTLAVLLLNTSEAYTIPLGISLFRTQNSVDLSAQFASLVIAAAPILIAYTVFNKQFVEGLRVGAVK